MIRTLFKAPERIKSISVQASVIFFVASAANAILGSYWDFKRVNMMETLKRRVFSLSVVMCLLFHFLAFAEVDNGSITQPRLGDCWEYRILQFTVDGKTSKRNNQLTYIPAYKIKSKIKIVAEDTLNALGRDGWELINPVRPSGYYGLGTSEILYMKRRCTSYPLTDPEPHLVDSLLIPKER